MFLCRKYAIGFGLISFSETFKVFEINSEFPLLLLSSKFTDVRVMFIKAQYETQFTLILYP